MMIEKLIIEEEQSEVIAGLKNGTLERYGCAIRKTSTLTITHFIIEPPEISQKLQDAPSARLLNSGRHTENHSKANNSFADIIDSLDKVLNKSNEDKTSAENSPHNNSQENSPFVITDRTITSPSISQLSSILQVSQIAAAASVLNLGVSIAGFAYMGHKLNQIQKSLGDVQELIETGFKNLESKLDRMSVQLSYLFLLAQESNESQKRLEYALQEVHRLLLVQTLAKMNAAIQDYVMFGDQTIRDNIRIAEEVRSILLDQATRVEASLNPKALLIADLSINGWMIALIAKAQLLVKIGRYDDAIQLLTDDTNRFKQVVQQWAKTLIIDNYPSKLATAYRFAVPRLSKHISPERLKRIIRISSNDRNIGEMRLHRIINEAQVELSLKRYANLGLSWDYEQVAIAEYLDGMSEILARLESYCLYLKECKKRGIRTTEDLFVNLSPSSSFYLLPVMN